MSQLRFWSVAHLPSHTLRWYFGKRDGCVDILSQVSSEKAGRHHQAAEATCQCVIVRTIIPCIVRVLRCILYLPPRNRYLVLLHTEVVFYIPQFIFPNSKILTTRLLRGYLLRTSYSYLLNTYYQNPGTNNPTVAPSIPSLRLPPYAALPISGSYYTARFVILPQFHFSSDHRFLLPEIRLPFSFLSAAYRTQIRH